ncbi:GIY-YIG nuclease family protein [Merismopedia glauca]|uniref:Nuclease subunit of the excinuclease complex n=1 Tax=Merismopedia glauca CCAP 1448/3 TaxID=1296344 RepID=A0A2T1C172_9CYAN|nr:GIY-YIG nuclease family protein [Merismopedia glauca]PSB01992.1 Nuclease subunit of the excinuclease complex [Merismopedia glauca CCAP 1448/3]
MVPSTDIPTLAVLEYIPYLDQDGQLPADLAGKIGVYAIFNQEKTLKLIGYSRDIYLSLKQHLVRQLNECYWVKAQVIERPNRTLLEDIKTSWIQESGTIPVGNSIDDAKWNQPIDAKLAMTEAEKAKLDVLDELELSKLFKNVARRVEAQILAELESRGVKSEIRFNPKLKENGLLDLK